MIVNSNAISFKGKIIDSHIHSGKNEGEKIGANFMTGMELNEIFSDSFEINLGHKPESVTVSDVFVSDLECIGTHKNGQLQKPKMSEFAGNEYLLKRFGLIKSNLTDDLRYKMHKDTIPRPMAVCQVGADGASPAEIEKLLKKYPDKFYGFKFHPDLFATSVSEYEKYKPYFEIAQKHNFPCLFHCGDKRLVGESLIDYSSPQSLYDFAKKIKNDGISVPIIMGHMGIGSIKNNREGLNVLISSINNGDANLYADTSWVDKSVLLESIDKLKNETKDGIGLTKILFGTDAPLGMSEENTRKNYIKRIEEIQNAIQNKFSMESKEIIDKLFYKNAADLFSLDAVKNTIAGEGNVFNKKTGLLALTFAGLVGLTVAFLASRNNVATMPTINNSIATYQKLPDSFSAFNQK